MAISRKRKHAVAEDMAMSKQSISQQHVKDSTRETKPVKAPVSQKKRKTVHERQSTPQPEPVVVKSGGKRKRILDSVTEEDNEEPAARPKPQERIFAKFAKKTTSTPQPQRFENALPPSPAQTPTKSALQLFDRLNLRATSPAPAPPSKKQRAYETPPSTPNVDRVHAFPQLPEELQDFVRLHSSFLTALGLHSAHNGGSTSAVSVKTLLPMITSSWRKRSVTINDLRKIIALSQTTGPSFVLEGRGRAGTFVARVEACVNALNRSLGLIDEADLSATFETALRKAWDAHVDATPSELCTARAFLRQLPLAEIPVHDSVAQAAPLFAKGQQRLESLKASQAAAAATEQTTQHTVPAQAASKTPLATANRGTSLLDRILAKQSALAATPSGPSKAQLERQSALQRVEEVARVLELLAAGRPRASFGLSAVVQHLQQSLRNPMSAPEAERCLGLMAGEIMPGFLSVLTGSVRGVVVTRAGRVAGGDLRERLAQAGA